MALPTSDLSAENVLRDVHDPVTQTLRTSATAIIAPGLDVDINHTDDSVRLGNGVDFITSTTIGPDVGLDVNIINDVPIEISASDGDNIAISDGVDQLAINSDGSLNSTQAGTWNINNISGTVSLPTGAATQTTLANIDAKIPVLGQALAAASVPVVLTAAQLTTLTPLTTVAATQSGTWNINNVSGTVSLPTGAATAALQTQPGVDIGDVTVNNASGAGAVNIQDGGNSITVDGAFFQATQPVSVVSLPLPTGAATSALQTTGNTSLSSIDGKLNSLGQKVMTGSVPVTMASNQSDLNIKFGNNANLDAFGRLRVSTPVNLFETAFQYDLQPLLWSSSITGGGVVAHNANKASVDFTLGTASGDQTLFQSKNYFKYHPGKSQRVLVTGNFGGAQTNCRKRIGQFDANNGIYFELSGTTASVNVRSKISGSVVNTSVSQVSWNLDKLDGTGSSGITLNVALQQIFLIDYQWLGSGRVRFGFIIDGIIIHAHEFLFANSINVPYSQTAILPIRFEVTNTGVTVSSTTAHLTCTSLTYEGGIASSNGIGRTASNGITAKAIAASGNIPIISIRKSTAGAAVPIRINGFNVFCDTTDDLLIKMTINGTLTGATFASTVGFAEIDVAASAISGGTEVYSFYIRGTGAGNTSTIEQDFFSLSNLEIGSSLASISDIITISATSLTGAASARSVINFRELY